MTSERDSGADRPARTGDPVLIASAGFLALLMLLGLSALVSPGLRSLFLAGFEALYEAMAGMAAACQWVL